MKELMQEKEFMMLKANIMNKLVMNTTLFHPVNDTVLEWVRFTANPDTINSKTILCYKGIDILLDSIIESDNVVNLEEFSGKVMLVSYLFSKLRNNTLEDIKAECNLIALRLDVDNKNEKILEKYLEFIIKADTILKEFFKPSKELFCKIEARFKKALFTSLEENTINVVESNKIKIKSDNKFIIGDNAVFKLVRFTADREQVIDKDSLDIVFEIDTEILEKMFNSIFNAKIDKIINSSDMNGYRDAIERFVENLNFRLYFNHKKYIGINLGCTRCSNFNRLNHSVSYVISSDKDEIDFSLYVRTENIRYPKMLKDIESEEGIELIFGCYLPKGIVKDEEFIMGDDAGIMDLVGFKFNLKKE